jgi:hypothetical protein
MEFSGERADWGWSQIEIRERDCSPCGSTETRVSFNDADGSLAASRDGFSSDGRALGGHGACDPPGDNEHFPISIVVDLCNLLNPRIDLWSFLDGRFFLFWFPHRTDGLLERVRSNQPVGGQGPSTGPPAQPD